MIKNLLRSKFIGLATGLSVALVGLGSGSAFAWTYGLSGSGACQSDGSFKITWKIDNSVENEALHVTASSNTVVVPVGTAIAAHHVGVFYQSVSGTSSGSYSLSVTGNFPSDQTLRERDATVSLSHACAQPGGMGGGQKDCDNDYDNSPAADCAPQPQKDCDNDYDNSPASECTVPQPQKDCDNDFDNSPATDSECQTTTGGGLGGGPTGGTTTTTTTGQVLGATTTATSGGLGSAQVAAVPTGSINGGEGGASKAVSPISFVGLAGSLLSVGSGLALLNRRQN